MDTATKPAQNSTGVSAAVAFIDLAGFSAIADVYGDAAAIDVLEIFERMVHEALSSYGPPIKWIGDEAMLSFPEPESAIQALGKLLPACRKEPRLPLTRTGLNYGPVTVWPHRLARRFAQHLLDIGVTQPVPLTEAQQARATLLAGFETYLVKHRGLSPRTIYHTLRFANRFLDHRFGDATVDPGRLRPADVISFIEHVLAGARRDKTVATHVRIFLQYLFGSGATATNLALSVPRAAKRWGARLPRHLSPEGVEAVLACVRDNPRHGARDYAMLLIMARLGLRAAEVIAIQLDDIDWRAGELLVRGKGKLHDRVPISAEVGEALSRYLREERGPASCRTMFVTHRAPHRPFKDSQIVNTVLKDALKATGQKPVTPYVGSHLLRHSLATQLVNSGASLDEVGDVLRHRSRTSTMIYARLDIDGLRSVAMPWPVAGGAQ